VEPAPTYVLKAIIESPKAVDADQMSREGSGNRSCGSLNVVVRRLSRIALALLDLLLYWCQQPERVEDFISRTRAFMVP
jgi:hypothetical protein